MFEMTKKQAERIAANISAATAIVGVVALLMLGFVNALRVSVGEIGVFGWSQSHVILMVAFAAIFLFIFVSFVQNVVKRVLFRGTRDCNGGTEGRRRVPPCYL